VPRQPRPGKIHGFAMHSQSCSESIVLAYGETEYALYIFTPGRQSDPFRLVYEGQTKDWINAALFLVDEAANGVRFVLHLAHSVLLHLQFDPTTAACDVLELSRCTDSSILYYTRPCGQRISELTLISGNAFGELLVWQPQLTLGSQPKCAPMMRTCPLLARIQAHNGVIHSIELDPSSKTLATTSDDRSVKLWRIDGLGSSRVSVSPLVSCFGHSARVMCALVLKIEGRVYVVSGGEDSYLCVWIQTGQLLLKRRQHFGAPIWRLGFHHDSSTVYSTSANGNLAAQNLRAVLLEPQNMAVALGDINIAGEFFRKIKFVNDTIVIGLSNLNRLFHREISQESQNVHEWDIVKDCPSYKRTILEVDNCRIATCGHRRITIHRLNQHREFECIFDGERLTGMIRSFFFMCRDYCLAADDLGNCVVLKGNNLGLDSSVHIPNSRESWLTSALLIPEHYLLLGDRQGRVMLFQRNDNSFVLKQTLDYSNVKYGANFFKLLSFAQNDAYVLSGGHESVLKYLHISLKHKTVNLIKRENVPLAWVEALPEKDLILGFNDNHIVAWSRQHDVVAQLACGGGHRCWDYRLSTNRLSIVFIKQKQVHFYTNYLLDYLPKRIADLRFNPWHTRNCNTLKLLKNKRQVEPLILSAGDDNIIKVTKVIDNEDTVQCAELHSHISSVRCLQVHHCNSEHNKDTWIIFSVGGRSQLCISLLNIYDANKCYVNELCSHILRNTSNCCKVEARLMAIEVVQTTIKDLFSLYIAGADGKISQYSWDLKDPYELQLLNVLDLKRCPLKLQWIENNNILLITTTSGEMYGLDKSLSTQYFLLQLHASGINTMHTFVDNNLLHVLSGGDDENVKYTLVNLDDNIVQYETEFVGIHNAQVNALSINLSKTRNGKSELIAYTCSTDKQIFKINLETREFYRIGYTCISDIKGMEVDNYQRMYFYGNGLQ
ncbi:hypothetical protein KR018_004828, partial [Drosophila ironensis]